MRKHTKEFKSSISTFGRELDSKITVLGTELILEKEDLFSITPITNSTLLKTVMKEVDFESKKQIGIGQEINVKSGVKVNGEYEYIDYGNYFVYKSEYRAETDTYSHICYDKMLKTMIDYTPLDITYPINLREYINAIATKCGLEFADKNSAFANYNTSINEDHFSNGNYTFRDVLDYIAQLVGGWLCINDNDELEIRYPELARNYDKVSGENVSFISNVEDEINTIIVDGKSTQATRSGKNLFNKSITPIIASNGQTITELDTGVKISCTNSSSSNVVKQAIYKLIDLTNYVGKDVRIKCDFSKSNENLAPRYCIGLCDVDGDNRKQKSVSITSGKTVSFTVPTLDSTSIYLCVWLYCTYNSPIEKGDYVDFTDIIITMDNEDMTYEPYGVSPSPDYPSEIKNIYGIRNYFNKTITKYDKSNVSYIYNTVTENETGITYKTTYPDGWPNIRFKQFDLRPYSGKTIRFKTDFTFNENVNSATYILSYTNNDISQRENISNSNISGKELSFVVPSIEELGDNYYLTITFSLLVKNAGDKILTLTNTMLTIEDSCDTYVPYGNWLQIKQTGKNLFNIENKKSITTYEKIINQSIPVGTYHLTASSITSNSTKFVTSLITFRSNGEQIAQTYIGGTQPLDRLISLNKKCDEIYLYANSYYNNSVNVTTTFSDLMISTDGEEYEAYKEKITSIGLNMELFDKNNVEDGKIVVRTTGELTSNTSYYATDYIEVEPNTKYTEYGFNVWHTACYDENKTYISNVDNSTTFTTPENAKYIRMSLLKTNINIARLQKGGKIVDTELCSIGEVKDELIIKDGKAKINKRFRKIVLNGSENWVNATSDNRNIYRMTLNDIKLQNYSSNVLPVTISNYFVGDNLYNLYQKNVDNAMSSHNSNHYLEIRSTKFSTVNELKTWLSTHNTTVYYELAEPYEVDLGEVTALSTFEGVNNVSLDTNIQTNMSLTYTTEFEELDKHFLKDVNVSFSKKYGAVNSVVFSRGNGSDNIYRKDITSITKNGLTEIKIADNPFLEGDDRETFIQSLFDKINGLEFYIMDVASTGIMYLELGDFYYFHMVEEKPSLKSGLVKSGMRKAQGSSGGKFLCLLMNDEIKITQGLEESIYSDEPEITETDYKTASITDTSIKNAIIQTNKNSAEILLKVNSDEVISAINLSPENIKISSAKLDIDAIATFTNSKLAQAGSTVINGANITTGSISCDRLKGGTLSGQKIVGGSISITTGNYYFNMGTSTSNPNCSGLNVGTYGIKAHSDITATGFAITDSDTGKSQSVNIYDGHGHVHYLTFTGGILTKWEYK